MFFKVEFDDCESTTSARNCAAGTSSDNQNSENNEKIVTPYLCEVCGRGFPNKTSVMSHTKWRHENPPNYQCSVCQKIFTKKFNLDKHKKSSRDCQSIKKNKNCSLCDFCALTSAEFLTHYEVQHGISIIKKVVAFKTFEEFKIWKKKFEEDTKSRFIKTTSTRRTTNGVNIARYICHRDGNFKSRGKGLRRMKTIGSNKINSHCPANIIASETNQSVKVTYIDTHIGHELDPCRLHNMREFKRAKKSVVKTEDGKTAGEVIINYDYNYEMDISVNDVASNEQESVILSMASKAKQDSFDKRKQDLINKTLEVCNTIENEEQLEAVSKQLASLESTINALSNNILIVEPAEESSNEEINTQFRFPSTKKNSREEYANPSDTEEEVLTLEIVEDWQIC